MFDLSSEPARLREAYGRGRSGQSLLAARRLVETRSVVRRSPFQLHVQMRRLGHAQEQLRLPGEGAVAPFRSGLFRPAGLPGHPRPVGRNAGRRDGRIWTHPANQRRRGARPLGPMRLFVLVGGPGNQESSWVRPTRLARFPHRSLSHRPISRPPSFMPWVSIQNG